MRECERETERDLRSLGIKTSTTLPYLSKRGKRSSAVVPSKRTNASIRVWERKGEGKIEN
jgi:hypothetical protein